MNQPSVSIIVPVYNVEPYVEDCIRSVMRQTYTGPMECIVVDDCGTDNSMAVVEKLVDEYSGPIIFKVLHHEHNRGLSAARNTGMDAAIGEYIFFLDSDDEMTDDCIEKLTEPLRDENYDFVLGFEKCIEVVSPNQVKLLKNEHSISDCIILRPPMILRSFKKDWAVVAWNRLYQTSFLRFNQLSFKEGLLFEDNLWSFQIACLASSMYIMNQTTYIYKIRQGSIMRTGSQQDYISNLIIIIQEMSKFVEKERIMDADVFPIFDDYFYSVLNHYSGSFSEYRAFYSGLRPYIKVSLGDIIKVNRCHLRRYMFYMHYILPKEIAPFWQFFIYYRLRKYINKRCR